MRGCFRRSPRLAEHPDDRASTKAAPIAARFLKGTVRCSLVQCALLLRRASPFGVASPTRSVISMTMTAQEYRAKCQFAVAGVDMGVILDPKPELCFMRYELTDYEWAAVRFGVSLPK